MDELWHSMSEEPTAEGVYELRYDPHIEYSYWNGEYWSRTLLSVQYKKGCPFPKGKSGSCYSGTITGWREVPGESYAFLFPTSQTVKVPQEFQPDEVKPELLSKRIRDWV